MQLQLPATRAMRSGRCLRARRGVPREPGPPNMRVGQGCWCTVQQLPSLAAWLRGWWGWCAPSALTYLVPDKPFW